ncbi:MAG: hypothetical protein JWM32_2896 [Verrucomicrobia bacterium]|nr:hypothetical protein [Verrucomicrobiota bacterium]
MRADQGTREINRRVFPRAEFGLRKVSPVREIRGWIGDSRFYG